jgi:hypothetical protein
MRKLILSAVFLTGITTVWLCAAEPAFAVGNCSAVPCPVAYVSSNGYTIANNGSNACVLGGANGCALISEALSSVTNGGTVIILDGASYLQSTTINKSVTITSEFRPTIAPPSGNPAFLINSGSSAFELNGVILDGVSGGTFGVSATNAVEVRIKNTTIRNFTSGALPSGINIKPAGGLTTSVVVDRTSAHNNTFGIVADGTSGGNIRGAVTDSIFSSNINNGITVSSPSSNVVLLVNQTIVSKNNFGLVATGANAGMMVRNSSVVNNATGLSTSSSGALYSYGNNSVNGNTTTDGTFTGVIPLK